MADKQISDLTSASALTDGSLFVLEQGGAAMKANWGMMKNYISPGVAAQYSSSSTYAVGDYVIYNGNLYRCTTPITTAETWTAAHWTAAVLGDDVGELNSAFDITQHEGSINLFDISTMEEGCYYWSNGKQTSSSYNSSGLIPVEAGKTYYAQNGNATVAQGRNMQSFRFVTGYDANGDYVADSAHGNADGYTVPNGVSFIRVGNDTTIMNANKYYMITTSNTTLDFVAYAPAYTTRILKAECNNDPHIEDIVDSIVDPLAEITTEEYDRTLVVENLTFTDGFMDKQGNVQTGGPYDVYHYTSKISVSAGDVVALEDGANMRCITAYNGTSAVSDKGYSGEIRSYTVPSGIDGVIVTIFDIGYQNITKTYHAVFPALTQEVDKIKNNMKTLASGISDTFDISSDNHVGTISVEDNGKNSIQFIGRITTFNGLIIARGYNAEFGGYVKVTPTHFEYYMGTEASPRLSEAHNLTFADYIAIRIDDDSENRHANFSVYTNGGIYTKSNQAWDVKKGVLAVRSVGTNVLTDCVLTYNCRGWNNPVHLYGDSYFGVYQDKWPYYMTQSNFLKSNFNAYPGRNSATALTSLRSIIKRSAPKMIVWCLGMNDGDSGAINASWKSCVEQVESICESKGIELVLATIPNVSTVDNTYKNAYVRNSGHRYIDFASAVGASDDSTWYTGMLSNDGVHPSMLGAIALFNQALADVPELMN